MTTELHAGGDRVGSTRRLLVALDGNRCRRGGDPIDMRLSGLLADGPTIGHIIPRSRGGTDDLANLGLEHRRCNLATGSRVAPPRALLATPPGGIT